MTFDKNAYIADVLKKRLRAQKGELARALRDLRETGDLTALGVVDIAEMFAVTPGMSDIRQHLAALRQSVFNKRTSDGGVVLLSSLLDVLEEQGRDLGDPAFWAAIRSAKSEALAKRITEFGKAISLEHQALKLVTKEELAERAQSLPDASISDLCKAVEANGVAVRPAIVPPTGAVPNVVQQALKHPEFRSVVDVLLLGEASSPQDVKVVDGFSYDGGKSVGSAQVDAAQRKATTAKDSVAMQVAQKVLTLVRSDFTDPTALHEMVFAAALYQAKAILGEKLPSATVVERLAETGLDRVEAARIVAHLSVDNHSGRGLDEVADLVASGALADARRMLDAIANPELHDAAELARIASVVGAAEHKKQLLVASYEDARVRQDFGAAEVALREAVRIDTTDERLVGLLGKLPPPTPTPVTAKLNAAGDVALTWRFEGVDDCSFAVVRGDGHVPANPGDGTRIATVKAQTHVDKGAPIGRTLQYAVFALRESVYSLPGTASVVAVPPPTELTATAGLTEITASWRISADAIGVRCAVIDTAGTSTPVDTGGASHVTLSGLVTGQRYRIVLEAVYVLADGSKVLSNKVTVDATPRGTIAAVQDLQIYETTLKNGRQGFRAAWARVDGVPVELWALPVDEKVPPVGTVMDIEALDGMGGRKVSGIIGDAGGSTTLEFAGFSDIRILVAVTVDSGRSVIGASHIAGSAPSPKDARGDRFGDELVVSWVWPHGDYASRLTWQGAGGAQVTVVTRAEYRQSGGVRLPSAGSIRALEVATIAFGNGREWTSAPVSIPVDVPTPVVSYQLRIPGSRFGKRKPVEVTATSQSHSGPVSLVAVVRAGKIMPTRVEIDDVTVPLRLDFSSGSTTTGQFDLPKMPSPFWVRLFAADGSDFKVQDPPTAMLKG